MKAFKRNSLASVKDVAKMLNLSFVQRAKDQEGLLTYIGQVQKASNYDERQNKVKNQETVHLDADQASLPHHG